MKIGGIYSFKGGRELLERNYESELREVEMIIGSMDCSSLKTKVSREKTMPNRKLYSPVELNKAFNKKFSEFEWQSHRIICEYTNQYYVDD
jgi:hypothetical protein